MTNTPKPNPVQEFYDSLSDEKAKLLLAGYLKQPTSDSLKAGLLSVAKKTAADRAKKADANQDDNN